MSRDGIETTLPRFDEDTSKREGALDTRFHFNYNDVSNINSSGSGRLPYFEGKDFSWYKHRMKMYLMSIDPPI